METMLYNKEGAVGIITMNRPKALNALNIDVIKEMDVLLDEIAADKEVKAVIITGSGDKSFVAGADIKYMEPLTGAQGKDFCDVSHKVLWKLETLPQPVIAAINGFCLGGGCELAMACDIRVASDNAVFAQPEVGLGIIPGMGGTQRLPRLIGKGRAKELLFNATKQIDANEAYRIGLVNKVAPQAELMDLAMKMATNISKMAPYAVQLCKEAVNVGMELDLRNGCNYEVGLIGVVFSTKDKFEGLSAFGEKRKPTYTGE